jgi:hypothetical protein
MKRLSLSMAVVFMFTAILFSGCARPAVAPSVRDNTAPREPWSILIDNATSVRLTIAPALSEPDSVELIYFHAKNPSHNMAVVGDNIKYAVDTYFADEVSSGKVKLTQIVSDDPANAAIVKQYDATSFALVVKETRGASDRIYPVRDIWEMTGDDNRDTLVNFIKITITEILAGRGS